MSEDTVIALALHQAADEFDLDNLVSTLFIAADGIPSVGISTNGEAKAAVREWLHARARKIQDV